MRLTAHGLGYRLPTGRPLFSGLDLTCAPGALTALTGPSGSGKSTLIAVLGGTLAPSEGTVAREGIIRIDWVHQRSYGTPGRTAADHVAMPFVARGAGRAEADAAAGELLGQFGLSAIAGQRYASLSGGERQRVMLARCIARRPDLILADEPTAALDARSAQAVVDVLGHLGDTGAIVVIATHDDRVRAACEQEVRLV